VKVYQRPPAHQMVRSLTGPAHRGYATGVRAVQRGGANPRIDTESRGQYCRRSALSVHSLGL